MNWQARTIKLLGEEIAAELRSKHILIAGLGGVGSHTALALARTGIGKMTIIDRDVIDASNINRQAMAFHSNIGREKVAVMAEMLKDINPEIEVVPLHLYLNVENIPELLSEKFDYIIDCVDIIATKLALIRTALAQNIPIISAMGTGSRLDPRNYRISDLSKTDGCRLARIIRKELRREGITKGVKVVYDPTVIDKELFADSRKEDDPIPSVIFAPAVCGMYLAYAVVEDLLQKK